MSKYIGTKAVNLSTTSADVTGNADIDGNLTVGGNLTVSGTTITVDSATAQTVDLGDDDKIRLGDDDDLQIYHDSATGNSVINESGGGNLTIQGNELRLQTAGGGNYFRGVNAGASSIFYSNSIRFETTTNGVKAHGNVVSEAASAPELVLKSYPGTQDTIAKIISGRSEFSGTNSFLRLQTNDGTSTETRIDITDGGDISFNDTSGNAKFFWDASAASLGIGTTTPIDGSLHLAKTATTDYTNMFFENTGASGRNYQLGVGGSGTGDYANKFYIYDSTASAPRLSLDSSGNFGFGTMNPSYPLTLYKTDSGQTQVQFQNSTTGSSIGDGFGVGMDTNEEGFLWNYDSNAIYFGGTTSGVAMRIDGSTGDVVNYNNLTVGTASASNQYAGTGNNGMGVNLAGQSGQYVTVQNQSDSNLYLSKKSGYTDNRFIQFNQNGSTVGQITSASTGTIFDVTATNNSLRLTGGSSSYWITGAGIYAGNSATRDLGTSTYKWRDLYLSGGVYLGGTASANKLTRIYEFVGTLDASGNANLSYPTGFVRDDTHVISAKVKASNGVWRNGYDDDVPLMYLGSNVSISAGSGFANLAYRIVIADIS